MFPQKSRIIAKLDTETYPLGEKSDHAKDGTAMPLVTLSHTLLERQLYAAMLISNDPSSRGPETFTVRRLMEITGVKSLSTIRRGLQGLVAKLSVERRAKPNGNGIRDHGVAYCAFTPEEVITRREAKGMETYGRGVRSNVGTHSFERVVRRVLENRNLSRREAQVALCCVEGLTNAEIGLRLLVTEQTVKFHLRNIFVKFGVRRRAELISRLLM